MGSEMYPTLGFNPCPGSPDHARRFADALTKAKNALEEANQLVGRMQADGNQMWQGTAANAFEAHLRGRIGDDLGNGHRSLSVAADCMTSWAKKLEDFWARAHAMEKEAAQAEATRQEKQKELNRASQAYVDAANAGQPVDVIDSAKLVRDNAIDAWNQAQKDLDRIRDRAEDMRDDEYEKASQDAAEKLEGAAQFSAKPPPGWLERQWNNITSVFVPQPGDSLVKVTGKALLMGSASVTLPFVAGVSVLGDLFGGDDEPKVIEGKIMKVQPNANGAVDA